MTLWSFLSSSSHFYITLTPQQAEEDVDEERTISLASKTDQNAARPNFGGEQAVLVPTSVKELGIPSELAEQAFEENQCFSGIRTMSEHATTKIWW